MSRPRPRGLLRRLSADNRGLALLEFAFALPIVLGIGLYGVETANLALTNMRVSQAALTLADNASRVGVDSGLATQQLREVDINDVFAGLKRATAGWALTTRGRIVLSSLEEKGGKQIIHWQRCVGLKNSADYKSHYGDASITDGTDTTAANDGVETTGNLGMGDTGAKVVAPPNSGVMFVEINYEYKPVVSASWLPGGSARIKYIASFIVRDRREFAQIYNPAPAAARATCNLYTT